MRNQNNAPAADLEQESFWGDLADECMGALPPLDEKPLTNLHNETDIFYEDNDYNNDEIALQISDESNSPDVEKEPVVNEDANDRLSKKRKRIYGQIGNRELKFLGIHNPPEDIRRDANTEIQKGLKLFGKKNQSAEKKARVDEFKITLGK